MAGGIRNLAREALALHNAGKHEDALCSANALSRANPDSALAHNLVGVLHFSAGGAARDERVLRRGDEPPSVAESCHFGAALGAFSAAARAAPNCVLTGVAHAEALNAEQRFAEAQSELLRVLLKRGNHPDPAVTNVGYNLLDASGANLRRDESLRQALVLLEDTTATINLEIVPGEAAKMLSGDAPVDQLRERAKLLSETYPYAVGAMLLRVHVELEQVRALGQGDDRRPLLRRSLALLSHAAGNFDSSLLIALFHAKVLFALDEFGLSETECRRALRIEDPTDPGFEDIPPAISVPGADCDARVASVRKQLRILLKQIVVVAAVCWSSMKSTQQSDVAAMVHKVTSVSPDTMMYEHYNRIDLPVSKTISEAMYFLKTKKSWCFFICPDINCDTKKFVSTGLLWEHLQSEHQGEPWNELKSVLGPDLNEYTSKDDPSLDGITFSYNSVGHMIFHLPVQQVFESLLLSPSVGIKAQPLVEMRQRKCRDGIVILEDIKEKLKMVPQDEHSTEFEEFRLAIKNLWLKFLETVALDYREVILPLARSFQWIQIKKLIDFSAKDLGRFIGGASIDNVFGKVPAAPDRDVSVKHGSKPSHVSRTSITDAELEVKGTSGQPVKEIASTSSCQQSLNLFNKNNADKDLPILSLIIRSFCNLEYFRDKFLTEPLAWIPSADNICIAQQFYEIFVSWEKNNHHLTDAVLTSMKTLLSRVDGTHFTEKLQVGTTFTSEIVSTILIGLHMSETCSSFSLKETGRHVVNPNTCGDCICPTHSLFGIKFDALVNCKCGERSVEYTTLFHKLAAGSPQTTKIKSFIELPVLSDEQFCKGNPCEECGELLNIDLFLSNIPHFFTIVLNWLGGSESQDTLSEVLASMTSPLDIKFFCKSAHCAARYTIKSMICYADDRYVCFARNEDKWLIYDFETVETEDTWEHLLERFKDCKLQPEVLFFEVIK